MPRVYYYGEEEVGIPWLGPDADRIDHCCRNSIPHPRFVWYEWDGFETTDDPDQADVFCVRQRLFGLTNKTIESLPFYRGDARHRHVFFGLGPDGGSHAFRDLSQFPGIFIRACTNRAMMKSDPDIVTWPWPVDDFGKWSELPIGGFEFDVVFQGYVLGPTAALADSIKRTDLQSHIVSVPQFWPGMRKQDPTHAAQLKESYCRTMQAARIALCPNSNPRGAIRYRFYEAMSMGRVNLFVGDQCVLPHEDIIDWGSCIIKLEESNLDHAGEFLVDWLGHHSDETIKSMGLRAQEIWKKWLRRDVWGEIVGKIVRERLKLGEVE